MKLKSKSGFSLVELMVVVAIIGILATIAIPNFQRFQARAKQSSAKTELTGIFTAEKAFYTEYNTYHTALSGVGYVPEGVDAAYAPIATNRSRVYASTAGGVAFAAGADMDAVNPGSLPKIGTAYPGGYYSSAPGCAVTATQAGMATEDAAAAPTAAATTFVAAAVGCPASPSQVTLKTDLWSMNELRSLVNVRAGLDK